jgi:site-specific recombinase
LAKSGGYYPQAEGVRTGCVGADRTCAAVPEKTGVKEMTIRELVQQCYESALYVYKKDQQHGSSASSVAFDAGRVDAFKELLDQLDRGLYE